MASTSRRACRASWTRFIAYAMVTPVASALMSSATATSWLLPRFPLSSMVTWMVKVWVASAAPVIALALYASVWVAPAPTVAIWARASVAVLATVATPVVRARMTMPSAARLDSNASVEPLEDSKVTLIAAAWLAFGTVTVNTSVGVLSAI